MHPRWGFPPVGRVLVCACPSPWGPPLVVLPRPPILHRQPPVASTAYALKPKLKLKLAAVKHVIQLSYEGGSSRPHEDHRGVDPPTPPVPRRPRHHHPILLDHEPGALMSAPESQCMMIHGGENRWGGEGGGGETRLFKI